MTKSQVHIKLDTLAADFTSEEVTAVFAALLREMRAAAPLIRRDERIALRRIMSSDSGTLTVADVFPDFEREGGSHMTLRRLRTAQFILPAGRDVWEADQRIAIKPFARLIWDRLGEDAIFGESEEPAESGSAIFDEAPAEEPEAEAAAVEEDDAEVDLALPDVNEPDGSEPDEGEAVPVQKNGAAAWDDDDVLDFLKDSKD